MGIESVLDDIRDGGPTFTPALGAAIALDIAALPAARPRVTTAERRVIEALAAGKTPKQMAHDWGVSMATVRSHIRNAKRKTGARTLPELASMLVALHLAEAPDVGT
jgi:DNA-binding CsgD family transcriptional regulator